MMSYHGSQLNIHLSRQMNHVHAVLGMTNKPKPNEAQMQLNPRVSVIKTQNRQTDS